MTLGCDYRIMAQGKYVIGLNEVSVVSQYNKMVVGGGDKRRKGGPRNKAFELLLGLRASNEVAV